MGDTNFTVSDNVTCCRPLSLHHTALPRVRGQGGVWGGRQLGQGVKSDPVSGRPFPSSLRPRRLGHLGGPSAVKRGPGENWAWPEKGVHGAPVSAGWLGGSLTLPRPQLSHLQGEGFVLLREPSRPIGVPGSVTVARVHAWWGLWEGASHVAQVGSSGRGQLRSTWHWAGPTAGVEEEQRLPLPAGDSGT